MELDNLLKASRRRCTLTFSSGKDRNQTPDTDFSGNDLGGFLSSFYRSKVFVTFILLLLNVSEPPADERSERSELFELRESAKELQRVFCCMQCLENSHPQECS